MIKLNPADLPIHEVADAVVAGLKQYHRLVVKAPTGSGKSTQIPQILDRTGVSAEGQILILQPRRLAARLLARRVAEEMGVTLGREVGYQIRFEDMTSRETRINFVTEGVLMRKLISDPQLSRISTLIFDEFHERHLYGDLSLARCWSLQHEKRPGLNLVVMSATLEKDALAKYLDPCAVVESEGRQFDVSEEYLEKPFSPERTRIWDVAAEAFADASSQGQDGDVLIFMPGAYEIQRTMDALRGMQASRDCEVVALHGELPPERQDEALRGTEKRKVIVATNVAETSITIPTVRLVIDGGLARINRFDPRRGINTLMIEKISRASADQRKGRAGRVAAGHCVRLWTRDEHSQRAAADLPEVRRVDLSESVLLLKGSGIEDLESFRWFEKPDPQSLQRALVLLADLGALHEDDGSLTEVGRSLLRFPVHPRYGRMLLEAEQRNCVSAVCSLAALAQGKSVLKRNVPRQVEELREDILGGEESSDFFMHMRAWKFAENKNFDFKTCDKLGIDVSSARQVSQLSRMFASMSAKKAMEESKPDNQAIRRCILAGFADQVARRIDQGSLRCELVHGRKGELARQSVVRKAPLIVVSEISEIQKGTGEVVTLLSLATEVEESWLDEMAEHGLKVGSKALYDTSLRRVVTEKTVCYHDLVLRRQVVQEAEEGAAAALLVEQILNGGCVLKGWDDEVEKWLLRVRFLSEHAKDLGFAPFTEEDRRSVLEQFCLGAFGYKDIKEKAVLPYLKDWLSPPMSAALERLAPERIEVGFKKLKVSYAANEPPSLSATIQELYDLKQTPQILGGKFPLLVKILAPNRRPVQVTQDLSGFWREVYPKLKPELQRRYPKHQWK